MRKSVKPTQVELDEILEFYEGVFGYSPQGGDEQEQRDIEVKAVMAIEYLKSIL